jgi:hypothetical protein
MLSKKLFGFIKGRSTALPLLKVMVDWTEAIEMGHKVDVIYTDFQKAFDSVLHKRFINNLVSSGIMGKVLNWLKNFCQQKQRVEIIGYASAWMTVSMWSATGQHSVSNVNLQTVMYHFANWSRKWLIKLDIPKCIIMTIDGK